ncbi:hypothetical protein [Methylophaga thalassica]|uniref:hypothetical protein n=1 Tax=Methylophaga thalassica TaxID=40223 RepID=UPI002E7BECF1|nr:hypothetical protein [Methylophaga thalassica]WVI85993.1 hypothetical protein VSX76_05110 [Methylophaga thalassica]
MNTSPSHTKIRQLIKQLENIISEEHHYLLSELNTEIEQLVTVLPDTLLSGEYLAKPEFDGSSGCYRRGQESVFYCPRCYERQQDLIATQRINSRLRVCPQCRASIKPSK